MNLYDNKTASDGHCTPEILDTIIVLLHILQMIHIEIGSPIQIYS